jgi:alpha-L-fucosidase
VSRTAALLLALALAAAPPAAAQSRDAWYRDAKFGLFIHWGIYAVLMDGEWVMENRHIRAAEYERIAAQFDPQHFDPAAWVSLAKAAGMGYITVTAKHHDGFAMFDTQVSDWSVTRRTPFGRDAIRLLADECRRQGMPLFIYYSQLDWHHPDYYPLGGTGRGAARAEGGSWPRCLDFMDAQPGALIASNHNGVPHPGEDLITFERTIRPDHLPAGNMLPVEVSEKINDTWGFRLHDVEYKSADSLIRKLVRTAGSDANFLLNVGPMPDGRIQPEAEERLRAIGHWMERFGRTIVATRGGPLAPRGWGVTTQRGDTVWVHILDWPDPLLALPLEHRFRSARLLNDGSPVRVEQGEGVSCICRRDARRSLT